VFSVEEEARAAAFARHVAPYADLLLARRQEEVTADPVAPLRTTLRLANVIGASPALAGVLKQASVAAPLGVSVLLLGESGTGKSQLARLIHDNSPRADGPFVEINCATVPEALAEGELFGALPGGHSTATRRMYGKVAAAEKGTLFLDEVGELSLGAQAKLLQLLQSKEYYPLGSPKPMRADIRLIAATNSDLERAVAQRTFREDLFYRLNVLPVRVPALAERRSDIPLLARHFCAAAWEQHHLPRIELSRAALRAIESAEWPGNVRQLANAVEAAVIRAVGEGAREVERVHVFPSSPRTREAAVGPLTFQQATREFQCRLLQDALAENDWNVVQTARRLDLARAHVYNLIRAFGLERAPAA
jgi:Nif-specific regulatory protein